MQKKILPRDFKSILDKRLLHNPAVALLGARQVGKSTLARLILKAYPKSLFLDLELPSDRAKLENDPELFLSENKGKLICLDEIQLLPDLFKTLRGVIDKSGEPGQFLFLGSASRDLIKQSSESLAGRIAFVEITPFHFNEIKDSFSLSQHWLKGGYPKSLLQEDLDESISWRTDYIKTFLERDIPKLGFQIPSTKLERFWRMLAHNHGQTVNYSNLGRSLGVTSHTIKNYIDILEQTFVVKSLKPYQANLGKRLIKAPKVFIRDTGLLHTLLGIREFNDLLGHPIVGHSFEFYIIENLVVNLPDWSFYFYRDSTGNEIDLVLEKGNHRLCIEIKSSKAPKTEKGFWNSLKVLKPDEKYIIALVEEEYPGKDGLIVTNLELFLKKFLKA